MPNTEIKNILGSINDHVQEKEKYSQIIEQLIALGFNGLEQDSKWLNLMTTLI